MNFLYCILTSLMRSYASSNYIDAFGWVGTHSTFSWPNHVGDRVAYHLLSIGADVKHDRSGRFKNAISFLFHFIFIFITMFQATFLLLVCLSSAFGRILIPKCACSNNVAQTVCKNKPPTAMIKVNRKNGGGYCMARCNNKNAPTTSRFCGAPALSKGVPKSQK